MTTSKTNLAVKNTVSGVNEIFLSWQGEGAYMGRRAAFIRFGGCNMQQVGGRFCYYCDTPHAFSSRNTTIINLPKLYQFFKKDFKGSLLVFTGGEPLLYAEELATFISVFQDEYAIQIETNGSLPFEFTHENFQFRGKYPILFSVSPKFPPVIEKRYPLRIFETMYNMPSSIQLKFVVQADDNLIEKNILSTMDQYSVEPGDIWLMPEGTEKSRLDTNMAAVLKLAQKYHFNISPRLQVEYTFK